MTTRNLISVLFILLIGVHLWAIGVDNAQLIHWTKPLLMPFLALYFWLSSKVVVRHVRLGIMAALVFSWLGDSLLMYQQKAEMYFLLGLGSFLVAQIIYVMYFSQMRFPSKKKMEWRTKFSVGLLVIFYFFMIYTLWNFLGGLKIPVIIYGACLVGMLLMAVVRKNRTNETSFSLLFFGAIAFLLSDSMLAVAKFVGPFPMASFWVMVTYIAAQALIVQGVLAHYEIGFSQEKQPLPKQGRSGTRAPRSRRP